MQTVIETISENEVLIKLSYSLVALVVTALVLRLNKRGFKKIKDLNPDDNSFEDMIPFLENLARLGFLVGLVFAILKIWGVDVTPLLGAAGVAGIAIAFAAQDSVANLFGGISIFFDKPFKIGDQVLVEGTQRGRVYKIGARSTKITTLDNVLVTIPNSVMVTNPIYNETGYDPNMRVRVEVGVAYGSDLEKVEKILLEILSDNEDTLEYPEPLVLFTAFAESSINVVGIATIPDPSYIGKTTHKLIKEIDKRFKEENIEIPFPQRDVHLHNEA